jgi:hypothetical protein
VQRWHGLPGPCPLGRGLSNYKSSFNAPEIEYNFYRLFFDQPDLIAMSTHDGIGDALGDLIEAGRAASRHPAFRIGAIVYHLFERYDCTRCEICDVVSLGRFGRLDDNSRLKSSKKRA